MANLKPHYVAKLEDNKTLGPFHLSMNILYNYQKDKRFLLHVGQIEEQSQYANLSVTWARPILMVPTRKFCGSLTGPSSDYC